MEDIGKVMASGGISSAMIAALYILYKCCYRRKFRSRCCGGEMSVSDEPSPNSPRAPSFSAPPKVSIEDK